MQHIRPGMLQSQNPLSGLQHTLTSEPSLYVCAGLAVCPRTAYEAVEEEDEEGWMSWDGGRDTESGGRWALRCDVISWKLLCVVILHPTEALNSTAYWLRKRPLGAHCLTAKFLTVKIYMI